MHLSTSLTFALELVNFFISPFAFYIFCLQIFYSIPTLQNCFLHNISLDHRFHTPHHCVAPNLHKTKSAQTHQDGFSFIFFFSTVHPLLPCCLRLREPVSSQAVWAGDPVGNGGHSFLQECLGGSPSV